MVTTAEASPAGSVLLVDDTLTNLELLGFILRPHYRVRAVTSGAKALAAIAAELPDLVLLDVMMPEMDGFEVLRRMRAEPASARVPVVFVTAATDEVDEQRGFDSGAADYIHKPLVPAVVLARVRAQLEAHAARELLRQANVRLAGTVTAGAHALEQAQRRLLQAEKLTAMGMLAAGVAHELNNPITYVTTNLESLRDYVAGLRQVLAAYEAVAARHGGDGFAGVREAKERVGFDALEDDLPALLDETADGVARIRTIVADLRGFSRADDDWQTFELHPILDSALNIARHELKYRCTVDKHYGELPPVRGVAGRLAQVFVNLVVNAAQAIEESGRITITTRRLDDTRVVVQVADTGKGIPPDVLPHIFEPFFTTKPTGKGTGLGLPTVQQIVERHGGRIDVGTRVGEGTTFSVVLPIDGRPGAGG